MRHARSAIVVLALSVFLPAFADDPPDATLNPQTGQVSVVDTVIQSGVQQVRCTTKVTSSLREVDLLGHPDFNGKSPRIAASPSGDLFVTWWNEAATPQVLLSVQTYPDQTWSDPIVLSQSTESSQSPRIVHDGSKAWTAYTIDAGSGTFQVAVTGGDDPLPWPTRGIVAETTYADDIDVTLDTDAAGHLWITWIDSDTNVGWVAYDYANAVWSTPSYESYEEDSVEDARERIGETVLGN
jgi:hypothetical protein